MKRNLLYVITMISFVAFIVSGFVSCFTLSNLLPNLSSSQSSSQSSNQSSNQWKDVIYSGESSEILGGTSWNLTVSDWQTGRQPMKIDFSSNGRANGFSGNLSSWERIGSDVRLAIEDGYSFIEGKYNPENSTISGTITRSNGSSANMRMQLVGGRTGTEINAALAAENQMQGAPGVQQVLVQVQQIQHEGSSILYEDTPDENDFNVTRTHDGNAVIITQYTGTSQTVNIPSQIRNLPVISIGDGAFFNKQLTSIIIPDSVITIGSRAFANNQLTNVTIPDNVTIIGDGAFMGNRLANIVIGSSVTTIRRDLFRNNHLTSVTIPNSVTTIGRDAFIGNRLTSVSLGNSVTTIEENAFRNNQLTSVTIPNSVTRIEGNAFRDNQLTNLSLGNNVATIGVYTFMGNQLTSVIIPNSVTTIGDGAFHSNQLTSVIIGNRVRIFSGAFVNNQITSITIGNNVTLSSNDRRSGSFDLGFDQYYNNTGWRAGTYVFRNGAWSEEW
jgi:hypothetical protein